jgi:hypothetical protein
MHDYSARHTSRFTASLSFAAIALAIGCGEPRIPTYPVQGSVKFDSGEPVPSGMVEFRPQGEGPIARGKLDQFGRFTLRTFATDDGAVAGKHRIVVVQHLPPQSGPKAPDEHANHQSMLVAPEFASYAKSGLSAEIQPSDENKVSLIVRRLSRP